MSQNIFLAALVHRIRTAWLCWKTFDAGFFLVCPNKRGPFGGVPVLRITVHQRSTHSSLWILPNTWSVPIHSVLPTKTSMV